MTLDLPVLGAWGGGGVPNLGAWGGGGVPNLGAWGGGGVPNLGAWGGGGVPNLGAWGGGVSLTWEHGEEGVSLTCLNLPHKQLPIHAAHQQEVILQTPSYGRHGSRVAGGHEEAPPLRGGQDGHRVVLGDGAHTRLEARLLCNDGKMHHHDNRDNKHRLEVIAQYAKPFHEAALKQKRGWG